jgi:predicted nucleic acid-binding Zn ribbon protein
MALQSLHRLLNSIEGRKQWQSRQQFRQLLNQWPQLVGEAVAAQTRPVSIQQHSLNVATASSAWAQNLMFERHRLMQKINAQLGLQLQDIRFSTAQWSTAAPINYSETESLQIWQQHPSRVDVSHANQDNIAQSAPPQSSDPQAAFTKWADAVRVRSQHLPLCPQCQCPTPTGELQRWSVCALCAAKQW